MVHVSRKPWVGGNWKCNGTQTQVKQICAGLKDVSFDPEKMDVVICPSALHLSLAQSELKGTPLALGLQNVCEANGAFTGEHSAGMALDAGCQWALVGHSERRQLYNETNNGVAKKVTACQNLGLKIAICIGETKDERETGKTKQVLEAQLEPVLSAIKNWDTVVIAYEPVWAIGTGIVATPEMAQETHQMIREFIKSKVPQGANVRIVYGGSVTAKNCKDLGLKPDIDGFLVGGASLKLEFLDIVLSCSKKL